MKITYNDENCKWVFQDKTWDAFKFTLTDVLNDIMKNSEQEPEVKAESAPKPQPKLEVKEEPTPEPEVKSKPQPKSEVKEEPTPKPEPEVKPKPQPKSEVKEEPTSEPEPEVEVENDQEYAIFKPVNELTSSSKDISYFPQEHEVDSNFMEKEKAPNSVTATTVDETETVSKRRKRKRSGGK